MEETSVDLSDIDPFATRFHIYLLACRELHERQPAIEAAAAGRLDSSGCVALFNEALGDFLRRCAENDPVLAARDLAQKLEGKFSSERRHSRHVVEIIADLKEAVGQAATTWRLDEHLRTIHDPAREIARRFFAASPHAETQARRERRCRIRVAHQPDMGVERAAMYHTVHEAGDLAPENAGIILIPFNAAKNFSTYLDYPFLFLHEYTAHAFAIDHGSSNAIFNDGWMMAAADAFFIEDRDQQPDPHPFTPEQVQAFNDHLRAAITGPCSRAITHGRAFRGRLNKIQPHRFEQITYDLAAFRPLEGEPATWPTMFVSRLLVAFRTDPGWLDLQVQQTATTAELMERLPPLAL